MVSHQSFSQWQQSPIQGAIPTPSPFALADESYLQEVLTDCRVKLESARLTAQRYSRLPDLDIALADAVTACTEALAVVDNPQIYQK